MGQEAWNTVTADDTMPKWSSRLQTARRPARPMSPKIVQRSRPAVIGKTADYLCDKRLTLCSPICLKDEFLSYS